MFGNIQLVNISTTCVMPKQIVILNYTRILFQHETHKNTLFYHEGGT